MKKIAALLMAIALFAVVCPAVFADLVSARSVSVTYTGATVNVEILSIPEGDDKPLKYPLMFTVCQAVIVSKIDTRKFFAFDDEAFVERVHSLNPDAKIFFLSAKTGEGFDAWTNWLREQIEAM